MDRAQSFKTAAKLFQCRTNVNVSRMAKVLVVLQAVSDSLIEDILVTTEDTHCGVAKCTFEFHKFCFIYNLSNFTPFSAVLRPMMKSSGNSSRIMLISFGISTFSFHEVTLTLLFTYMISD